MWSSWSTVCGMSSWLIQEMLVPLLTVNRWGVNAKLSMLTWITSPDDESALAGAA